MMLAVYGGGLVFALVTRVHAPLWWWVFGVCAVVGALLVPEPGARR